MEAEDPNHTDNPRVFLDITFGTVRAGRIIIELLKDVAPKTVENFRALCTGELGLGKYGKPLHYKGCKIIRIIPHCFALTGDIINNDGSSGESIYGDAFDIENVELLHTQEGMVGMATIADTKTVNSQFYITCAPCEQLDGTNIIFGKVLKGLDIVKEMATVIRKDDRPVEDITICDSGELKKGEPWNLTIPDDTCDIYPPWPNDWDEGKDVERVITTIRESGNFYFARRNYIYSQNKYLKVLRYIDWAMRTQKSLDHKFIRDCKFRTLLNLAAVKLKRDDFKEALNYCNQCESIDANNGKLYYRRAQARLGLRDIDEALGDLRRALNLLPNDKTIQTFFKFAKSDKLGHLKKEREFFSKVFR